MWNTPIGNRVLEGSERKLWIAVFGAAWDMGSVSQGEDGNAFSIEPLFRSLRDERQKRYMVYRVARALLDSDFKVPLDAIHEATLSHLFDNLATMLCTELDGSIFVQGEEEEDDLVFIPHLMAILQSDGEEECTTPQELWNPLTSSPDSFLEVWYFDHLFHDRDWEMYEELVDLPKEASEHIKSTAGIESDYYAACAPYPSDEEWETACAWMDSITEEAQKIYDTEAQKRAAFLSSFGLESVTD